MCLVEMSDIIMKFKNKTIINIKNWGPDIAKEKINDEFKIIK